MDVFATLVDEIGGELGRHRRAQERRALAGRVVALGGAVGLRELCRYAGAAGGREARGLGEVLDRQQAGHDGRVDPGRGATVAEAQEGLRLEEELRDRRRGAGIDLAAEPLDVGIVGSRLGMTLGIGPDADLEPAGGERVDQLAGVAEPVRVRLEPLGAFGRVAAQGHDLPHAGLGEAVRDGERVPAGGADAGEVRGDRHLGPARDGGHGLVRELSRRSPGAVGHGDEAGSERHERADRVLEPERGVDGPRREEFERDFGHAGSPPGGWRTCAGRRAVRQLHNPRHHHEFRASCTSSCAICGRSARSTRRAGWGAPPPGSTSRSRRSRTR